ncbi:hypothetical protein [Sporosarcina sp. FSL K6-3457]|uniref:hypothetical protein n=1 Tax=Sporosarcina sp. FSL K6-3457 TaxID=2978204 RepID=UPI0030F8A887
MEVQWINGQYPEDKRIFDSEMEVFEWTNSLYPDFSNSLCREENVGYVTPDEKVIDYLTDLLPQWADYLNVQVIVHKDKIKEEGKIVYRIWTSKEEKFEDY